jgi:hypothetical protein
MRQKRRSIAPMIGAWQGSRCLGRIKREGIFIRPTDVGKCLPQRVLTPIPVIQCPLQGCSDGRHRTRPLQIAAHDHQSAVSTALQSCQFHRLNPQ